MSSQAPQAPAIGLDALVAELRAAKLEVSASEVIDAARVLRRLGESTAGMLERSALGPKLRPIFCKSAQSRATYDAAFARWAAKSETRTPIIETVVTPPPRPPRRWPVWIAGASLLMGSMLVLSYSLRNDTPKEQTLAPIADNSKVEPAQRPSDGGGDLAAHGRLGELAPLLRRNEVLRPWLAWLLVSIPVAMLAALLFAAALRWGRFIDRISGAGHVFLSRWTYQLKLQRLVPALTANTLGRLDRHARVAVDDPALLRRRPQLDVPRTLVATARRGGLFSARYREQRTRPSYLILVDAVSADSLLMLWAARWREQGLAVDIRRLQRDAGGTPLAWQAWRSGELTPLDALPAPGTAQRLVFLGDGADLLDAEGRWQQWSQRLRLWRWAERALFTPVESRDWGARETLLAQQDRAADAGFFVLPLEDAALSSWSQWLAGKQFPEVRLSTPERFPPLLSSMPARYLETTERLRERGQPLSADEVRTLVAQLQAYLGENGFYWLCCCAVPPILDSELTQLLGEEYFHRAGVLGEARLRHHLSRTYPRLARLPWITNNYLPTWLRVALLARLPKSIQDEVRTVVRSLLSGSRPVAQGSLSLSLSDFAAAGRVDGSHSLYAGFLQGNSASELMLQVPGEWNSWLRELAPPQSRWQRVRSTLRLLSARALFRQRGRARAWTLWMSGSGAVGALVCLVVVGTSAPAQWPASLRAVLFEEAILPVTMQHGDGPIRSLAFNADGTRIVSVARQGTEDTIRVWDASTGRLLSGLRLGIRLPVYSDVILSPDGKHVAIVSGKSLEMTDSQGLELPRNLCGATSEVSAAAFSADGLRVACSTARRLGVWQLRNDELVGEVRTDPVFELALNRDGTLAATFTNGALTLWDIQKADVLGKTTIPLNPTRLAFSSTGRLLSGNTRGALQLWDTDLRLLDEQQLEARIGALAFGTRGVRIAVGGLDGRFQILQEPAGATQASLSIERPSWTPQRVAVVSLMAAVLLLIASAWRRYRRIGAAARRVAQ